MVLNCQFSEPVNYTGSPPASGEPFAFSGMTCNSDQISGITNGTTGSNFYINKTLSYGDILILIFLILFFGWGVLRFCWNFVFKDYPSKV